MLISAAATQVFNQQKQAEGAAGGAALLSSLAVLTPPTPAEDQLPSRDLAVNTRRLRSVLFELYSISTEFSNKYFTPAVKDLKDPLAFLCKRHTCFLPCHIEVQTHLWRDVSRRKSGAPGG